MKPSGRITLEAAAHKLCAHPRWSWSARWWRLAHIIVATPARSWSTEDAAALVPSDVTALGCRGSDAAGRLAYCFWDFDVGHGKPVRAPDGREVQPYATTEEAIEDARRLRDALDGLAEIRLSKSGAGVHVRYMARDWPKLPAAMGPVIAKLLAAKLHLRVDASPLGRQCAWLWCRNPPARAFELVEAMAE